MLTSRLLKTDQRAEFECIGNKIKIVNQGLNSLIAHTHNTYLLKNNFPLSTWYLFSIFFEIFISWMLYYTRE